MKTYRAEYETEIIYLINSVNDEIALKDAQDYQKDFGKLCYLSEVDKDNNNVIKTIL